MQSENPQAAMSKKQSELDNAFRSLPQGGQIQNDLMLASIISHQGLNGVHKIRPISVREALPSQAPSISL